MVTSHHSSHHPPRLSSAIFTQVATLQEETNLLKQDLRKLKDQHRRQEKVLQSHNGTIQAPRETNKSLRQSNATLMATIFSTNNRVDMYDQIM